MAYVKFKFSIKVELILRDHLYGAVHWTLTFRKFKLILLMLSSFSKSKYQLSSPSPTKYSITV